ncbi:PEP-CTERM motif protein [Botrimarina colliarenosi]|uniref:PEP-CTERM motif protein n=1 Tax=Botrimarina colliarenosi TaxID=2528001 RepID=A0A5C6AB66_9BACT|nr:PEP-CTERM sorting domain-containing protein [Botrimarina colliarenosi]TWT96686.1 PEP-CTERM motif protein [Botrimarina colliarenosi]
MKVTRFVALALGLALPVASQAASLYSEDFNVDPTANWTVNDPAVTDTIADFFYDYSAIGVPAAPGGTGTTGLKMTANNTTGVFGGFSVSPTGQSFTGDYVVEFDMWQNYVGPLGAGGSGTTQLSMAGIGTSGTVGVYPGFNSNENVLFAVTLDGGSSSDFRAYSSVAPTSYVAGDPVYAAPSRDGVNAYYTTPFPGGQSAPGDQIALFPGQTGAVDAGEVGFAWRKVAIQVAGGFATWSIDGTDIATVDLSTVTLGGGNILFGHSDTNGGVSSDANDFLLNVTLIDNLVVTAIPEPATLGLVALGFGLVAASRRRS